MYTNYILLQQVGSSITTSSNSIKHETHMKKLQLHDNSNKAAVLSITVVLNQQYMCTKGSEEQLN